MFCLISCLQETTIDSIGSAKKLIFISSTIQLLVVFLNTLIETFSIFKNEFLLKMLFNFIHFLQLNINL